MYQRNAVSGRADSTASLAHPYGDENGTLDLSSLFAIVEAVRSYPHSLGKRLHQVVAHLTTQRVALFLHLSSNTCPESHTSGSIHHLVQYEGYVYGTLCTAYDKKTKRPYLPTQVVEQVAKTCGIIINAVEKEAFVQFQARRLPCSNLEPLTIREREVLMHMGQGHTQGEIARLLQISPTTVATYRQHIYAKWGVNRPLSAVLTGHEAGLFLYLTETP